MKTDQAAMGAQTDLSSLGVHIEKYTACLFVCCCFFIPDNKCAVFINAWKVVMICAGQDLLHHRTHPTPDATVDLSLSVT